MTPPLETECEATSSADAAVVEPWRMRSWLPSLAACVLLVAAYVVLLRYTVGQDAYRLFLSRSLLSSTPWVNYVVFCLLVMVALLAPGSTALVVLAGLPVFGPTTTFALSLLGGLAGTVAAHRVGWWVRARSTSHHRWTRVRALEHVLTGSSRRIWLLSFASRALPNPLYDVWAYAFGYFRVPLHTYLPPAFLGGALALFLLCYGARLLAGR